MSLREIAANPWALLALPVALYVVLAVAVARRQSWSSEIKLAVAGTGVVLIAVWMMSFDALMAFFGAAYVTPPLNALGPVAVDGEMAVGTVVWIAVGSAGVRLAELGSWRDAVRWLLSPRPYVALLVGLSAALSSVANAVHPLTSAAGYHLPAPWSYGASAVPGVVMFAVIHQLVILFRVLRSEARPVVVVTEPPPSPGGQRPWRAARTGPNMDSGTGHVVQSSPRAVAGPPPVRALPAGQVTLDQYREARRRLGDGATHKQLAADLGCSTKTVQRREREDREDREDRESSRPRVVGE